MAISDAEREQLRAFAVRDPFMMILTVRESVDLRPEVFAFSRRVSDAG